MRKSLLGISGLMVMLLISCSSNAIEAASVYTVSPASSTGEPMSATSTMTTEMERNSDQQVIEDRQLTSTPIMTATPNHKCEDNRIVFKGWSLEDNKRISQGYFVACSDGSSVYQISSEEGYQPSVSPDGERLAIHHRNTLKIINLENKSVDNYLQNTAIYSPAWTHIDDQVAFLDADGQIHVLNLATGIKTSLGIPTGFKHPQIDSPEEINPTFTGIAWSPIGTHVALITNYQVIYFMEIQCSVQGCSSINIWLGQYGVFSQPSWSPDGKSIATICMPEASINGSLCIINRNGTLIHQFDGDIVGVHLSRDSNPSWSSDGERIAFSDGYDIFLLSIEDMSIVNLTNELDIDFGGESPVWLPR